MSRPAVRLAGLSHTYPDGREALRGLTLTIEPGERVGVLGLNGAGKTTLFLRLAGVLPGTPGVAEVAGLDPAIPADRRALPAKLGVVFQNPDDQLFAATLAEDVAFGPLNLGVPPASARKLAEAALDRVGLAGFGPRSPHRLSGGEQRRAALAGVLAMEPEVLLLDEPTIFLDAPARRGLVELLSDWPGTLFVATHDLALVAKLCRRVLVLRGGELVADGGVGLLADAGWVGRWELG